MRLKRLCSDWLSTAPTRLSFRLVSDTVSATTWCGLCIATLVGLAGCALSRADPPLSRSEIQSHLNRKNFRVVKANAQGSSNGFALLGIIPLASPSVSEAMHQLHRQINAEGRAMALVNVAQDQSTTYLVLFSIPTLTVSADAIEFLDEPATTARPEPLGTAPAVASPPPRSAEPTLPPRPPLAVVESAPSTDAHTVGVEPEALGTDKALLLEIVDLQEMPASEKGRITLSGTLMNRGTRPTTTLTVKVEALDEKGDVVMSIGAVPSTNAIAADGGTATFSAVMDDRPTIKRYHVEAFGFWRPAPDVVPIVSNTAL